MVTTRMMESRMEALGRTLAIGLLLPKGFEEKMEARLSRMDANFEAQFVQHYSPIAHLEKIVERFVKEGNGKAMSAETSMN